MDKNGWFAPMTLGVVKSDDATFRATKSSPVEKGSTETVYDLNGKITTRIITTASNLKYYLQVQFIMNGETLKIEKIEVVEIVKGFE